MTDAPLAGPVSGPEPGPSIDRRACITPEAFHVATWMYGLPLARPWRRLAAIGIDAVVVAVIAQSGGLLLAVALTMLAYGWLRARDRARSGTGRGLPAMLRGFAVLVLFFAVLTISESVMMRLHGDGEPDGAPAVTGGTDYALSPTDAAELALLLVAARACDDADCRRKVFDELAEGVDRRGGPVEQRRAALVELADVVAADATEVEQLRTVAAQRPERVPPGPVEPDPAAPAAAGTPANAPLAPDGSFSILRTLQALAADLGFSLGWGAVYFTLLTVYWNGQTLGKRWLGIRVVSLGGQALRYGDAFDRYGGYAAGFATGLLGFLQVYWDPNRQAIHDKVAFTAVIRDADGQAVDRARRAHAGDAQPLPIADG